MFTIVSSFYLCCLASYFQKFLLLLQLCQTLYSSDISKSNKRQISKSNISKTTFLKNDKSGSFLDFYLRICLFEDYPMKIVEVTIGHFLPNLGQF